MTERAREESNVGANACDVEIRFGSFAAGIDRRAAAVVEALVKDDPGVASVTRTPPAREGEYSLCVATRSPADSDRLFHRIAENVPSPVSAPVTIIGPNGRFSLPTDR